MTVNTSITNAVVVLVIVMLIAGLLTGLALAGIELLNPKTGEARANEINRASAYQARKNEIDLESYQEQRRMETEFRRRQQEQELAHQRELQALARRWFEIRQAVLLGAIVGALLLASGGLAFYLAALGYRALRQPRDPWRSPEWREGMRTLARTNELLQRQIQLARCRPGEQVAIGGNGHHQEPAWEN